MNPDRKTCSVCIANYNGENTLADCLKSVRSQITSLNVEIIVHDDASTDRSLEILKKSTGIRVIRSLKNLGFCKANNRMASAARGDFLLFLNNDAILVQDSLQVIYEKSRLRTHKAILGLPQYDAGNHGLLDLGYRLDIFLNPIWNRKIDILCYVSGACMWVPRAIWEHIGGFPKFFGSVGEDLYLCLAGKLLGYQVDLAYGSKFFHHVGRSLGGGKPGSNKRLSTTFRRRFLSERNRLFVMWLTYPLPALLAILPCHVLISMAEGLMLSVVKANPRPLSIIYLKAIKDFLRNLKLVTKERKRLHGQKKISQSEFFKGFIPFYYRLLLLFRYGFPRIE